jgi:hypothetical protein
MKLTGLLQARHLQGKLVSNPKDNKPLNFLKYIFVATNDRISRFHSLRGELMPISAFARIPLTIFERLTGKYKYYPWQVPSAISWLSKTIKPDWKIFEFGCGYSTIWFAKRCYSVTGVEDNLEWYNFIKDKVISSNIGNCNLIFTPAISPLSIDNYHDNYFDLVVVDSYKNRVECAQTAISKVKREGYIIVDDTDISILQDINFLRDWNVRRFVGVKPNPFVCTETSVFQRPK